MKKAVALFMAIILVAAAFAGCGNNDTNKKSTSVNKSYEDALDIFVGLLAGKELSRDQVKSMQPKDYFSYMEEKGSSFSDYYTQVQQQLKTNENAIVTAFGKDYEVSHEIIEDSKMSNDEQYQATKHLHSEPWYEAGDLEEIHDLVVEISIEGEKNSRTFEADIQVMKHGGGWYILGYECDEMESFLD